jgi:choline dehydrogenase-like flavoprotein
MIDFLIIGSGPAGVAAAKALLARGKAVTMIDGGKSMDAFDSALQKKLAGSDPSDWSHDDKSAWQTPQFETPEGQVRRYGSDAAVEAPTTIFSPASDGIGLRHSLVKGGLSQVWGGAVRPYSARDMADWPVNRQAMVPHYRAIAEFMPIAGPQIDDLPAHPGPGPGPQAQAMLARFPNSGDVSLHAATTAVHEGCHKCGLCLHGCPWDKIWKASALVDEMSRNEPRFTYQNGPEVVALRNGDANVVVDLADGTSLTAKRAFLGTGVLQTARLLLDAYGLDNLTLHDSQFAFLPLLHRFRAPNTGKLPLTTLPQLFADIAIPSHSPHNAHAQIYGWNEFYIRDLVKNYSMGVPGASIMLDQLAHRMLVAQIFLHSDLGARIKVSLGGGGKLAVSTETNVRFQPAMKAAQAALSKAAGAAGAHALKFASRTAQPGASFHVGASLPMSENPTSTQTDILGRPAGAGRIHVIDASVLPSIPAMTITFSVMANAHRIASEAAALTD